MRIGSKVRLKEAFEIWSRETSFEMACFMAGSEFTLISVPFPGRFQVSATVLQGPMRFSFMFVADQTLFEVAE